MIVSNTAFIPTVAAISLPYMIKDIASCVIAYLVYMQLKKVITVE